MLTNVLSTISNLGFKVYFQRQVPRYSLLFITKIMESPTMEMKDFKSLLKRVQEAKQQADRLRDELVSIKGELEKAELLMTSGSIYNIMKNEIKYKEAGTSKRWEENDGNDSPAKKKKYDFPMKGDYVVVYTDGACENNGSSNAKAGIGVWFSQNHPSNVSKPVIGKATNNTAEIQACISAVEIAKANGIRKMIIITDSQFTINSMTKWLKGWKNRGWKLADGKSPVKNQIDFQKLDKLCCGLDIKWEHVNGHSGVDGNENADKLAREGAKLYKSD